MYIYIYIYIYLFIYSDTRTQGTEAVRLASAHTGRMAVWPLQDIRSLQSY